MRAWARPARIGVALTLLVAACGGGRSDIDFGFPPEAAGGSIGSAGVSGSSQTGGLGGSAQGGIGGSAQGGIGGSAQGGSAQGGIGGAPDGGFGGAPEGGFGGAGAEGGFGGGPAGAGGGPAGAGGVGGRDECLDQATSDCDVCVCQSCGGERRTCLDDGGCAAILRCVAESGCSGPSCYFGPCRQVIDDNGGPGGPAIALLQELGNCIGNSGCPCGGGAGGNAGNSGNGGNGFGGNAGNGFGGNGFGGNGGAPGGCVSCIAQNCPAAQQCFADQACRSGVICAATQCGIGGGSGGLQCVLGCFNGDAGAAIQGVQALQCVASSCGGECGGPGGGFGGG